MLKSCDYSCYSEEDILFSRILPENTISNRLISRPTFIYNKYRYFHLDNFHCPMTAFRENKECLSVAERARWEWQNVTLHHAMAEKFQHGHHLPFLWLEKVCVIKKKTHEIRDINYFCNQQRTILYDDGEVKLYWYCQLILSERGEKIDCINYWNVKYKFKNSQTKLSKIINESSFHLSVKQKYVLRIFCQ